MKLAVKARRLAIKWADKVFKGMAGKLAFEMYKQFQVPGIFVFEGPVFVCYSKKIYGKKEFTMIGNKWRRKFYQAGFSEFGIALATEQERKGFE